MLKTFLEWYENQNNESLLLIGEAIDLAYQDLKFKSHFKQNPQIVTKNDKEEKLNFSICTKNKLSLSACKRYIFLR
jgi:hypothetical protein